MRFFLATLLALPSAAMAADIGRQTVITCVSDQSSLQARHKEFEAGKSSDKARSMFSEMLIAENFGGSKSKIKFVWIPRSEQGPQIRIETNEKAHALIHVRSKTRSSAIAVTSASSPFSTESWTFVFNFAVETMIATRVQSNVGGVKGEVITYDCRFDAIEAESPDPENPLS